MAVTKEQAWPRVALRVVIHLVGMVVGGFFGMYGSLAWGVLSNSGGIGETILGTGMILGGLGGLLAGHWWCKRMARHWERPSARLILWGGGNGVIVGLVATAFLHGGLAVTRGILGWESGGVCFGGFSPAILSCALGAGFVTGCVCGSLVWIAARARPGRDAT